MRRCNFRKQPCASKATGLTSSFVTRYKWAYNPTADPLLAIPISTVIAQLSSTQAPSSWKDRRRWGAGVIHAEEAMQVIVSRTCNAPVYNYARRLAHQTIQPFRALPASKYTAKRATRAFRHRAGAILSRIQLHWVARQGLASSF